LASRLARSRPASNSAAAATDSRAVASQVPRTPTSSRTTKKGRMILARIGRYTLSDTIISMTGCAASFVLPRSAG